MFGAQSLGCVLCGVTAHLPQRWVHVHPTQILGDLGPRSFLPGAGAWGAAAGGGTVPERSSSLFSRAPAADTGAKPRN